MLRFLRLSPFFRCLQISKFINILLENTVFVIRESGFDSECVFRILDLTFKVAKQIFVIREFIRILNRSIIYFPLYKSIFSVFPPHWSFFPISLESLSSFVDVNIYVSKYTPFQEYYTNMPKTLSRFRSQFEKVTCQLKLFTPAKVHTSQ